jgi:hypothetical protein
LDSAKRFEKRAQGGRYDGRKRGDETEIANYSFVGQFYPMSWGLGNQRRIAILAMLLVAVVASFLLGFRLGGIRIQMRVIQGAVQTQAIQMSVDKLLEMYPQDFDFLSGMSDETELREAIASALFGKNQKLNSSNVVFLVVQTNAVEDGQLHDPFGLKFDFHFIEEKDDIATNGLKKRILVITE